MNYRPSGHRKIPSSTPEVRTLLDHPLEIHPPLLLFTGSNSEDIYGDNMTRDIGRSPLGEVRVVNRGVRLRII